MGLFFAFNIILLLACCWFRNFYHLFLLLFLYECLTHSLLETILFFTFQNILAKYLILPINETINFLIPFLLFLFLLFHFLLLTLPFIPRILPYNLLLFLLRSLIHPHHILILPFTHYFTYPLPFALSLLLSLSLSLICVGYSLTGNLFSVSFKSFWGLASFLSPLALLADLVYSFKGTYSFFAPFFMCLIYMYNFIYNLSNRLIKINQYIYNI